LAICSAAGLIKCYPTPVSLNSIGAASGRYQESQSYEELEDERLLDDVINEMGMVAAPPGEDNGEGCRTAEQEVSKEIRGVSEYLLDVHRLPPGWKRDGVTRVRVMLVVPLLNSSIRYFSFTMNSSVIACE
jgi:hypothetical protein